MAETPQIFGLISKVMADIGAVGKNQENTFSHYRFRGIDDVYNAVNPAMVKHGIFCIPQVVNCESEIRQSSKGEPQNYIRLTVSHQFFAPDGSSVAAVTVGEAMDWGDKAANKAMSAAYKYALFETFCIPTQEDKDTENASPEGVPPGPQNNPTVETPNQATDQEKRDLIAEVAKRLKERRVVADARSIIVEHTHRELRNDRIGTLEDLVKVRKAVLAAVDAMPASAGGSAQENAA